MIEENKIAMFDAYRNEELPDSDKKAFEQRIEKEPLFKLEYEEYLDIVAGIRLFERERLKQFLMESDDVKTPTKVVDLKARKSPFTIVRIMAAAAVLLLLISAFNFFTFENRIVSRHQIDLISDNTMGEVEEDTRTVFYEALKLKKTGKNTSAIEHFKRIDTKDINVYFLAQYEIALLEIEQRNITQAKTILTQLIQRKENHFVKTKASLLLKDLNGSKLW